MTAPLAPFRVHFADGRSIDISAANPKDAREFAQDRIPGVAIQKIKIIRESRNGESE